MVERPLQKAMVCTAHPTGIGAGVSDKETELLSIGQAAKKAGVSRQSLQYYLMVGLLEPSTVTPTGRRLFDHKAIERIRLIRRLNEGGYPLRDIRELFMEGRSGRME